MNSQSLRENTPPCLELLLDDTDPHDEQDSQVGIVFPLTKESPDQPLREARAEFEKFFERVRAFYFKV